MNDETPQQDTPSSAQPNQPTPSDASAGGMKIIQPLDPNLVADNAAQPKVPTQPTPAQQTQKAVQSPPRMAAPSMVPQQALPNTNLVHPDAPSGSEATASGKRHSVIIVLVIALGLYTAAPALLRLAGLGKLISLGFVSSGSVFITVLDIIYLVIGIGLVLRKEIARAAYVFFAVIFLLLALYGTFKVYSQQHSQSTPQGNLRVQLQYDISYCLTKPPSTQRSQIVQQLENDVNNNQQPTQTCTSSVAGVSNQYVALIPSYLLAILPLVFLTRPSIKQVFS